MVGSGIIGGHHGSMRTYYTCYITKTKSCKDPEEFGELARFKKIFFFLNL